MLHFYEAKDIVGSVSSEVGGKACELAWLEMHGYRVPPWVVIPAKEVREIVMKSRQDLEVEGFMIQLTQWWEFSKLQGWNKFIVRSSANCEDGQASSFAGMFESYGHLTTVIDLYNAIRQVFESSYSDRVQTYANKQEAHQPIEMSVIVQVMIPAMKSGVLFTADPADGCRSRFLISSALGDCEDVVTGQADCNEYSVELSNRVELSEDSGPRVIRRDISHHSLEVRKKLDGGALTKSEMASLIEVGKKITLQKGRPVDIEWVMTPLDLFVVQVRDITSMGDDIASQREFNFDNSNIQESFNGLTLPLTFSFANEAYFEAYRQLMRVMGFSAQDVAEHDRRHQQMLALVKGRVYYNINSWYQGLLFLPSFGRNKEDMEKMMGLDSPVSFVQDQIKTPVEKLKALPSILRSLWKLAWAFSRLPKTVPAFRKKFHKIWSDFPDSELYWMTVQDLIELREELKSSVIQQWHTPIVNDFYVMMKSGKVRRTLEKCECEERLPELLAGEDLESIAPTRELIAISDELKKIDGYRELFLETSAPLLKQIQKASPPVYQQIAEYIKNYGDRVVGELKLETLTLRQKTDFLESLLKSYVGDDALTLKSFDERQMQTRKNAELAVFSRIRKAYGRKELSRFKKELARFRQGVGFREAMRLDRTRSFGMFRAIYRTMGKKLTEQGWLKSPEDIFYLTSHEIDDFVFGKSLFDSPQGLIQLRRAQYKLWKEERPPANVMASVPLRKLSVKKAIRHGETTWSGLGCYPGVIEEEVVVVDDPSNCVEDLRGKILVAERTDPGWAPLFMQIKGLIVERGSMLSHSAVVARELGLTTVVGVPGIFDHLKTGDRVLLDGAEGRIELLSHVNGSERPELIVPSVSL